MFDYEIDNLTLLLLLAIVATLLYERIAKPSPLAHPLLLGKQAEVSAVRKEGESGVYRSFATGHGTPFVIRPANTLKTLADIVQADNGKKAATQRTILDVPLTNEALRELIRLLPLGLKAIFQSKATEETGPILVVLPPGPSTALPVLLLALAAQPSRPLIILPSPQLLITALKAEDGPHPRPSLVVTHESIAEGVIEQVAEGLRGKCAVLIAGDTQKRLADTARAAGKHGIKVGFWEDLWEAAEGQEDGVVAAPAVNDTHSYFYFDRQEGAPEVTMFTHLNFTAGIAGLLALFPADKRPAGARGDMVASATPLTTPIGLTIALASIWSGAGFRLVGDQQASWDAPSSAMSGLLALTGGPRSDRPSIIFGTAQHHNVITSALQQAYRNNALAKLVSGSKLNDFANGYISRDTIWDKLVWRSMRNAALGGLAGDKLRALIVVGEPPSAAQSGLSSVLLSLPTSRISTTHLSAGPLTVSHFYDLQSPMPDLQVPYAEQPGVVARVGAPANNVELVLRDVADPHVDGKAQVAEGQFGAPDAIRGRLRARGPALGSVSDTSKDNEGWVDIGTDASAWSNGTFSMSPAR